MSEDFVNDQILDNITNDIIDKLDALDTHIDKCQEFVSTWEVEGETDDEDVTWNKQDIKKSMQLFSYFTEMKVHLEESKLARAEVTNNVT